MHRHHAALALVALILMAACDNDGPVAGCTSEFQSITLVVQDASRMPVLGMTISDTVIRTGFGFLVPQPLTGPSGTYVIFDDTFKDRIWPAGDSVQVIGAGSDKRFAATFFFDVPSTCHVRKASGPDTVVALASGSGLFRLRPSPSYQEPRVRLLISNAQGLAEAEGLLQSGEGRWAIGTILPGDGGFNAPWHWHLDPATVRFAEVTIEACQTTPQYIEQTLDYWITFGQVCIHGVIEAREG